MSAKVSIKLKGKRLEKLRPWETNIIHAVAGYKLTYLLRAFTDVLTVVA